MREVDEKLSIKELGAFFKLQLHVPWTGMVLNIIIMALDRTQKQVKNNFVEMDGQ